MADDEAGRSIDVGGEQSAAKQLSPIRLSIQATVILERRIISRSYWSVPSWYLHTVAIGEHLRAAVSTEAKTCAPAGASDKGDLFAWSGFDVILYKDACERYWHSLIGDKPLVYVICRDEADETDGADSDALTLQPVTVTVDYDAASAAAETDVPVLSAPIPGDLYRYMEEFVLTHYKPQPFKKRKRRNWSGDERGASNVNSPNSNGPGSDGPSSNAPGDNHRNRRHSP